MKTLTLLLNCLSVLPLLAHAQQLNSWVPMGENLLSVDYNTFDISATSENVVWSLLCKDGYIHDPFDCKVIRSIDGGKTWKTIDLSDLALSYAIGIFALDENTAWITAGFKDPAQRKIFKTSNGGESWEEQYAVNAPSNRIWAPAVKFINKNKGFFIDVWGNATGRTENGGQTWLTSPLTVPSGEWYWGQLAQKNWWDIKGDTLWWGTSVHIGQSTNGGMNWNNHNISLAEHNTIQSIKFTPSGLGLAVSDVKTTGAYVAIEETVILRSKDFGASWERLNNLPFPLSIITYVPGTTNTFIGTSGAWYAFGEQPGKHTSAITRDGGNKWEILDQGIPRNAIEFFSPTVGWAGRLEKYNYGSTPLSVGQSGNSSTLKKNNYVGNPVIFKWANSIVSSSDDKLYCHSMKVSPNPFTEVTKLEFELTDPQQAVEIEVIDLLGRILHKQIIIQPQSGLNQVTLDIDAPSGMLLLCLRQGKGLKTLKLFKNPTHMEN